MPTPTDLPTQVRELLTAAWQWLATGSAPAPTATVVACLLAAVAAVAADPLWRHTRPAATWMHEAGHAVAATTAGARITGLRLAKDGSGSLSFEAPVGAHVVVAAAGYPAPALFAVACAGAYHVGYPRLAIVAAATVVLVLAATARGLRSIAWTAAAAVAVAGAVAAPVAAQQVMLLCAAGFGAAAGVRAAAEAASGRATHPGGTPDAVQVGAGVGLPAGAISALFVAVCLGCAAAVAVLTLT